MSLLKKVRFLGYDLQYFAAIEPQRRLAPHVHIAIRGTVSRTEPRHVLAATYHQVWWPPTSTIRHDNTNLPVWHDATGRYLDPATGEFLPTWDQAQLSLLPLQRLIEIPIENLSFIWIFQLSSCVS